MAVALASTTLSVLPVFMLGALAVFVRRDLSFSLTELGASASAFYGTSALASIHGGRSAQRLGPESALAIGAACSAAALLGVAGLANGWRSLSVFLVIGGCANALSQPAANALVARDQLLDRQGISFGTLQTPIPLSTLLAGLAVPSLGANLGWRWAFVMASAGAIPIVIYGLRHHRASAGHREDFGHPGAILRKAPLYVLAVAGGFAAAPANALGAFYVESAVSNGISVEIAGLWLMAGSVCGICGRLMWGWGADRGRGDPLRSMSFLLLVGVGGFVLLGKGERAWYLLLGTVIAFGAGWAWKGLYNLAIVQHYPGWASAALGVTQAGVFAGSVCGPLGFGVLLERTSYLVAWTSCAVCLGIAPGLVWLARRMLRPHSASG